MSTPNDGGPAFPVREAERFNPENNETHAIEQHWGMTLRDWFAGQALAGVLANQELLGQIDKALKSTPERNSAVVFAYGIADAMLKARAQ